MERRAGLARAQALAAAIGVALLISARPAAAAGVEDFYKGKTVTIIIGYSVGGGYDLYGRLLARHLGKHIPGQPDVVPQNMTGAGSLSAAQLHLRRGAKDGTAIGTFRPHHRDRAAARRRSARSTARSSPGSAASPTDVSLCVTSANRADQDLERLAHQAVHASAAKARAPIPTSSRCCTRTCSAPSQAGDRLSRHQRRRARHGARRGRRPLRPVLEHAEEPPSATGSTTRRSTSSSRPASRSSRSSPTFRSPSISPRARRSCRSSSCSWRARRWRGRSRRRPACRPTARPP